MQTLQLVSYYVNYISFFSYLKCTNEKHAGFVMKGLEERVHRALQETTLSNSEIARRCNVARSTVGLWKDGKSIRSDNLSTLCTILGIDDHIESSLRPQQRKIVRVISSLSPEYDDILSSLEKLLSNLDKKK